ncbi:hypothetical protein [Pseudovibrio brasiliensis]|uniref:HD domain-containing protein n=1 Tax=Pseudovibrio brasiliensis TaxID=1898042 RepID=A0ABX8AQM4_9HYPH|nr:hypothetical protein [Pseudovibrio brasiliensis]QUS57338.1 hypothetical protein KGB56_08095 [Pseudovibrio brasiliensis]
MTTITTRYGRTWDLLNPQACAVSFWEIAEVLARIPRFNGHTQLPYSVAQHCCLAHDHVCEEDHPELRLLALLHDAHEAYIGDIVTPVKKALNTLIDEDQLEVWLETLKVIHDYAIRKAAGIGCVGSLDDLKRVKEVDTKLLLNEQCQLMHASPSWDESEPDIAIKPWGEELAAAEFLERLYANSIYQKKLLNDGNLSHRQFLGEIETRLLGSGIDTSEARRLSELYLLLFLAEEGCEFGAPERRWDANFAAGIFYAGKRRHAA